MLVRDVCQLIFSKVSDDLQEQRKSMIKVMTHCFSAVVHSKELLAQRVLLKLFTALKLKCVLKFELIILQYVGDSYDLTSEVCENKIGTYLLKLMF